MVPGVPQCVVLNNELRGDRCAIAQGEGRRPIQLVIGERAAGILADAEVFRLK